LGAMKRCQSFEALCDLVSRWRDSYFRSLDTFQLIKKAPSIPQFESYKPIVPSSGKIRAITNPIELLSGTNTRHWLYRHLKLINKNKATAYEFGYCGRLVLGHEHGRYRLLEHADIPPDEGYEITLWLRSLNKNSPKKPNETLLTGNMNSDLPLIAWWWGRT
jgi:hypothetical protein